MFLVDIFLARRQYFGMKNALENYRIKHGLSYAALGRMTGRSTQTVYKHCKGTIAISGDAAIRYSRALGIALEKLYPSHPERGDVNASPRPYRPREATS